MPFTPPPQALPGTIDHVFPCAGRWHYVCGLMVRGPFPDEITASAELLAEQRRNRILFPFRPPATLTVIN